MNKSNRYVHPLRRRFRSNRETTSGAAASTTTASFSIASVIAMIFVLSFSTAIASASEKESIWNADVDAVMKAGDKPILIYVTDDT